GEGGHQLSLRSPNLGKGAFASVWEEGRFASSPGTVVHLHAFLPRITLFGVFFAPDAYVSYDVSIERSGGESLFTTTGVLSEAGFAAIGVDVGAVFDARHHTVTVPPFFVDVDFVVSGCCEFVINLFKSLRLNAANGVEVASGEIIDPFEISSSLRTGFTFTDVAGAPDSASAPEPATLTLLGGALSLLAMRRKRACPATRSCNIGVPERPHATTYNHAGGQ